MSGDGVFKWFIGCGEQPEEYFGAHDTRDAALKEAWDTYPEGDFTIAECDRMQLDLGIFRADEIFERIEEHNEKLWGYDAPEFKADAPAVAALEAAVRAALEEWWKAHKPAQAWAFDTMRNEEYFAEIEPQGGASAAPRGREGAA